MKFRLAAVAVVIVLAACTPKAETDGASAPPAPAQPDIAAAAPASGPASPNTTDTLSSTPVPGATPAPPPPAQTTTPPAATAAQLANGRAAYTRVCAMCHGPTGQGVPNLGAAITLKDLAAIKDTLTKGMTKDGKTMPPMAGMLQGDELDDVAKFVAAGLPQ